MVKDLLLPHEADINVVIENLPMPWAKPLAQFVSAGLRARRARKKGAEKARQVRSNAIDAIVLQAHNALPPNLSHRDRVSGIERRIRLHNVAYGQGKLPTLNTIRRSIKRLKSKGTLDT